MKNKQISVIQIARELGTYRQNIFEILEHLGIERKLRNSYSPRGPKIAYITTEEYETVKEYFFKDSTESPNLNIDPDFSGAFYLIQLEPEHDPGRFKVGFTTNPEEQFRLHKVTAPYSIVLKTWPCKLLWEETAIECAAQDCEMIYADIFRTDAIETIRSRCDQFFALLPKIDNQE